ncbi:MAG: branched-chain amino acid ABC transporter permease [Anaerolineae bacterium]
MTLIFQQLVSGLSIGAVYALLAVGYALVYSVYGFTNWSFDALLVGAAFAGYYAVSWFNLPWWAAVVAALAVGVGLALLLELAAYRPLRRRGAPRVFMLISAMGANLALINLINLGFGGAFRAFPPLLNGSWQLFGVALGKLDLLAALLAGLLLLGLRWLLYHTRLGLSIRASTLDLVTASLMGVDNNALALVVFAVSGVLAGISGLIYGMKYAVYPYLGIVTLKAMIAAIIGGLGSLEGAVLGSLLLGVLETLVSAFISSAYRDLFSFGALILILLVFPNGLLGARRPAVLEA